MEKEYFQPRKVPEKKEITITLNMGTIFKLLRGVFVLLLVGGVFMLGRYSVDWNLPSFDFGSTGATTAGEKAVAEETTPPAPETTTEAAAPEPVPEVAPAEVAAPETSAEGTAPATDENVVNTYNNVELTLDDMVYTWDAEGASGKITAIAYSLINGESGTIKPRYFILTMDKYEDKERKTTLDTKSRSVAAGETSKRKAEVANGFSYAKSQLGDMSAVAITVQFFDAGDKLVASKTGNFKLER